MRLAHGWELIRCPGFPDAWIAEFVRPAIHAVPRSLAARPEHGVHLCETDRFLAMR
jgi:hypothetical protein